MSALAMGCQTAIAAQIVNQGGDYVLGIKGNQGALHEAVEDFWTVAQVAGFAQIAHDFLEEVDKDHGRLEVRRYWISEGLCTLPDTDRWIGLRSIGMVERVCTVGDTTKTSAAISSTRAPPWPPASPMPCGHIGVWRTFCTGAWT